MQDHVMHHTDGTEERMFNLKYDLIEISFGMTRDKILVIEECANMHAVASVRGSDYNLLILPWVGASDSHSCKLPAFLGFCSLRVSKQSTIGP